MKNPHNQRKLTPTHYFFRKIKFKSCILISLLKMNQLKHYAQSEKLRFPLLMRLYSCFLFCHKDVRKIRSDYDIINTVKTVSIVG